MPNLGLNRWFHVRSDLEIQWMTLKNIAIGECKLDLQSGNTKFGSKLTIFCLLWPWNLTRWPWIGHLCSATSSWVHHFIAICEFKLELWYGKAQIGAKFVLTSVTLNFDLWPWPFAWTLVLSMVITPKRFMMIRLWTFSEKGVTVLWTDGQTHGRMDRWTEPFIELLGHSLKSLSWQIIVYNTLSIYNIKNSQFTPHIWATWFIFWISWRQLILL